jgi:radical SAM protein with 4Fe4S-binding SPASM domain
MLSWAAAHNATHITINQSVPAISSSVIDTSFCLPPDELASKSIKLYKYGKSLGLRISFLFNVPFCLLSKEDIDILLENNTIMSGCSVRSGSAILFNVHGDLITCNHLPFYDVHSFQAMESVYSEKRFGEFWRSDPIIESIRQSSCVYRSHHCKACYYWDMCAGGCPLFWAAYDPNEYISGFKTTRKEVKT